MKVLYKLITLLCLLTSCADYETKEIPLPTFDKQIQPNENILFFMNGIDNNDSNEVIAFDSEKSEIIYRYTFPRELVIYRTAYDWNTDKNNIYIMFLNGRTIKLNILTGKIFEFENINLIREPDNFTIFNNEVWISPNHPGAENCPVKYFVYTPATDTSRYEELPEGILSNATPFEVDNNIYLPLYMSGKKAIIYNYTIKENLDISALGNNVRFSWHDYYNGFLTAAWLEYNKEIDTSILFTAIHKVKTTNPKLETDELFELKGKGIWGIYETEQFIFICTRESNGGMLEIRDRNTYEIKGNIPLETENLTSNYVCDGYFYCVKGDTHGVYKISLEDFSVTVIE